MARHPLEVLTTIVIESLLETTLVYLIEVSPRNPKVRLLSMLTTK